MTKKELLEILESFTYETEIVVGGAPAAVYYQPSRGGEPAYLNFEDEYSQRDDLGIRVYPKE